MISLTYSSEGYYLFWHRADDSRNQVVEFSLPARINAGASEREARPPLAQALRVASYRFTTVLAGTEPRLLDDALRAKTTEKIMVPFWPGAMPQADYAAAPLDGGLNISFEVDDLGWSDFSTYEIHTARAPSGSYTLTDNTWTAPLLVGVFDREPDPGLETDELQDLEIRFREDGPVQYALDIDAVAYTAGPTLEDAKYLFPFAHDFAQPAKAGGRGITLERRIIGQGRESTVEYHGGLAYGTPRYGVALGNLAEACSLIRFFQDRKGVSENFWLPGYVARARLTDHVAAVDTTIEVDDVAPFASRPYICLVDRLNTVPLEITAIADPDLTVGAVGTAFRYDETSLCELLLVRFAKTVLRVTWQGGIASAGLDFKELRAELAEPSGETLGETQGATPRQCSLYHFTDGTAHWYLTSYEQDLSHDSKNWVKHPVTHGKIDSTITLDDSVTLTAEPVEGSPLLGFRRHEIPRLWVTIYRADVSGAAASNARWVFTGEVIDCPEKGHRLQARAIMYGTDLDRQPRGRFQNPCWYKLFGAGCTLSRSDWIFSAEFSDVGTPGFPYTFELDNFTRDNLAALPGGFGFLNWFAWGQLVIDADGQKLGIQSSTALSLGKLTVTLDGDPETFPSVTDTVKLVPSCNKQYFTCKAYDDPMNPFGKFGNEANWGGHICAPGNLSFIKASTAVGGGKK